MEWSIRTKRAPALHADWASRFLCEDLESGSLVVVELKRGLPSDRVVSQTARYMGWVDENLADGRRGGWLGRGLARCGSARFQPPPVEPCMRFSRTRLTDALHRRCSTGARQARFGLGATTVPWRLIRPSLLFEWMSIACP